MAAIGWLAGTIAILATRPPRQDGAIRIEPVGRADAAPAAPRPVVVAADAASPRVDAALIANVDGGGSWTIDEHVTTRGVGECGGEEGTRSWTLHYANLSHGILSFEEVCPHGSGLSVRLAAVFDFDGDGVLEAVVSTAMTGPVGAVTDAATIYSIRNGEIVAYTPPEGGALPSFSEVSDVDDDGRPDLLSRGEWEDVGPKECGGGDIFLVAPIIAYHARPGGAFVVDEVTQKHLKEKCEAASSLSDVLGNEDPVDFEAFGNAIACARAGGSTAANVERELRKSCAAFECPKGDEDAGKRRCPAWSLKLAKKNPRVVLSRP